MLLVLSLVISLSLVAGDDCSHSPSASPTSGWEAPCGPNDYVLEVVQQCNWNNRRLIGLARGAHNSRICYNRYTDNTELIGQLAERVGAQLAAAGPPDRTVFGRPVHPAGRRARADC